VEGSTIDNNLEFGIGTEAQPNAILEIKDTLIVNGLYGIQFPQGNLSIVNCNISASFDSGIYMSGLGSSDSVEILDSYFGQNSNWALRLKEIRSVTITNTIFHDNGNYFVIYRLISSDRKWY
jgi:hypothetical protein